MRDQPRSGDEILAEPLSHAPNLVLMIPRILLVGTIETKRIVETENPLAALIL